MQDSLAVLGNAVEDIADEVVEAVSEVKGELAIGSTSSAVDSAFEGIVEVSSEVVDSLTATGFLRTAPDGTGSSGTDQGASRNRR